ncbi:T9SS type A sorting domain-containing protein [Pedobacter cryophilus]|uniref:T9SS type A sorting domain-containing protein n=1 Tax=Pedobacter cryophilus TaxID=2571271 RepID=A0A4V5P104_9SPHI|nr:T9SS type A sorting domain-containing protein [Pedobacter cryophilus]TKC00371.1 T9SS type A sorting domain-containing protein [Pedobacter cryophilus]
MKKLLPFLFVLTFLLPIYSIAQTCVIPAGGVINGGATGCTDRVATYTISGVSNATTYNWVITGAQDFTRVSDTEYSIVFASANVTIQVTPINQTNGPCAGPVVSKTVAVSASPAKPVISQTATTLTSTTSTSYQWYVSNTLIIGAISQTYNPTQSGVYRVEAKNTATGCSTFSDPINYFTTAIREDARFKTFSFYPNPVVTSLHTNFSERYNLEFYDTSGRKVFENNNLNGEQETDLTSLNRGMYLMRIISGDKRATRKLILK